MPSENDRKKLQRLKRIRQDAKAELVQRIAEARKELSAKILAGAQNPKVVTSTAFRESFYSQVSGQYEAMGIELDAWLKDLVKTTGSAFRKETVLDIKTKTGASVDSSVVKFDRKLTEDYWKLINPDNAKSLTAVFTENMNKAELDMLRTSFVETQRQAKLSGWTAREQHKALQASWDAQAGNAASDRFVDAAGRKWTNARYMDMLIQTTTARIGRESAFDAQIEATGSELVKVVNVGESCPICQAWDGVVLSITGRNKDHPSYNAALRAGMFHPLCDCLTEAMDETLDADLVKKQAGVKNPDIKPKPEENEVDFKKRATTAVAAYRSEADGGAPAPASVASVEKNEPAQQPDAATKSKGPKVTTSIAPTKEELAEAARKVAEEESAKQAAKMAAERNARIETKRNEMKAAAVKKNAAMGVAIDRIPDKMMDEIQMPRIRRKKDEAYYEPSTHEIFMDKDPKSWHGHPTTADHELAHSFHFKSGALDTQQIDPALDKAMTDDYAAWQKDMKAQHGSGWGQPLSYVPDSVKLSWMSKQYGYGDDYYALDLDKRKKISRHLDTIGGLSGGAFGCGHSESYYQKKAGKYGKMEAFANIYTAIVNDLDELTKAFPLTAKEVRRIIGA